MSISEQDYYQSLEKSAPPCPLCGGADFQALAGNDRYGMRVQTAGCRGCGLVQTWPRPTEGAMERFYREDYRAYYQGAVTPGSAYVRKFRKAERLEYTAGMILRAVPLRRGARILDVGCAEGTLFAAIRSAGGDFSFVGVEPNDSFASHARATTGCATYPDIESLEQAGGAFDVVIVNHVLEHVGDPVGFLRRLGRLLDPGGRLFVDVPDVDAYEHVSSLHIAHLFHFSARTLERTLQAAGFRMHDTARHAPPSHPRSIWAVAGTQGGAQAGAVSSAVTESLSWERVRALDRALPGYLLRRRLRRPRWLVSAWHVARRTLGRA